MGRIKIKEIKYEGDSYYYSNNKFKDGPNIILGENGNGKSTFTYLIIYALGGSIPFFEPESEEPIVEIINDTNNYVEMVVAINDKDYVLNRKIGCNHISIYDKSNEGYITLSLIRNGYLYEKENRTFSDWIFENIGINLVEINQNSTTHRLNFDDLMRLMYYDQRTENRKVISEFAISTSNFYKNGIVMKRSIFEILISNFFKEYYNTYFKVKELIAKRQEYSDEKSAIEVLIQNLKRSLGSIPDERILNELEKDKNELDRLVQIRTEIKAESGFEDNVVLRLTELQREIVKLISYKNTIEQSIEDFEEDLNKSLIVKENIKTDIRHLEKILFTSQYINIINEGKCPFCQDDLKIEEKKCICGSDNYLDYHRFIYSDKEYISIMKSKIKGLKTTNETIDYCESERQSLVTEYEKIEEHIRENMNSIKQITDGAVKNSNSAAIDEITDRIIRTKEKVSEMEIFKERYGELTGISRQISIIDASVEKYREKLDKLEEEKQKVIEKNLANFEKIYEEYLKNFYGKDVIREVSLNRNYMPIIGEYKEQSFNVPKRAFYYLSLLRLSLEQNINFPRFLLIDTMKAEGIDLKKLKKLFLHFNKFENMECQIILTSGYEEQLEEMNKYVIERLTDENKLLKKKS